MRAWLVAAACGAAALGCAGEDGPRDVACPMTCECAAGDDCAFDCSSGGCLLAECLGGRCTASCADGRCALDCDDGAVCTYDCEGGRCSSDCDQGSRCDVRCPGGACEILCDEGSTCTLDCTGAPTPCQVLCEVDGRATCTGNCETASCG